MFQFLRPAWKVVPDTTEPAQVVVACDFGLGRNRFHKCKSNIAIAQLVVKVSDLIHRPICAQHEIACSLPRGNAQAEYTAAMSACSQFRSNYKDTMATLREMTDYYLVPNKLTRIALVGHILHVYRVAACARKLGLAIASTHTTDVFDHNSFQPWCRGPRLFKAYELCLARPWYRWKKYM